MTIVLAILGLGLLIVLHEGGHFLVARLCRMRVERFSVGFGPAIIGIKRGGTLYQIAPIPFGGYVQITGLNPNEEFDSADPYVFPNRPRWMRLATILAGPLANYVAAFAIMLVVFASYGVPSRMQRIIEPVPGKPAAAIGLKAGDVLVEANGRPVSYDAPISATIREAQGGPVTIKVLRDGKPLTFTVKPDKLASGEYQIGIQIGPIEQRDSVPLGTAVGSAVRYPVELSVGILNGIYLMIRGRIDADVQGPVGITKQIAKAARSGAVHFLEIIALLSVYLGLINLLPFPALDGGRALFLGIESVTRTRVNPRIEAAVHMVGFLLLVGVLLIVTFKDIFLRG